MTRNWKSRLATLIALSAVVTLTACGREEIMSPSAGVFSGKPILLPAAERPVSQALAVQDFPSMTVLVSAQAGGTVRMGRYTLDFPPGALKSDTPITITQADPSAMIVEFQPHGIHFLKPVTFSAQVGDLVDASMHHIGVAWLNDETGQWEPISQQPSTDNTASAELWHFSGYEMFGD